MQGQKYGDQPAVEVIYDQRWTYTRLALELGVTHKHLYAACRGVTTPSDVLRKRLPEVLGVPLADLYTAESLTAVPQVKGPGRRQAAGS